MVVANGDVVTRLTKQIEDEINRRTRLEERLRSLYDSAATTPTAAITASSTTTTSNAAIIPQIGDK
jgi:hypothetical protein